MLSRILGIPLLVWLGIVLYRIYIVVDDISPIWLVPPVLGLAIVITFNREFDNWFFSKRNRDLEPESIAWLRKFSPFYENLPEEHREPFRVLIQKTIRDKDFIPMSGDSFPDDVALSLTHDHALFQLHSGKPQLVDTYVLYNHPFLTPRINEKVHSCEFDPEDKVLIVSAEQLLPGFLSPRHYINTSFYAHAQAFLFREKNIQQLIDSHGPDPESLFALIGQDLKLATSWVGLDLDPAAITVYAYAYHPEVVQQNYPKIYQALMDRGIPQSRV
jgi:MtfA peptidase